MESTDSKCNTSTLGVKGNFLHGEGGSSSVGGMDNNKGFRMKRTKIAKLISLGSLCSILWIFSSCWISNVEANNNRGDRLLYQNRHWTDSERSAIATVERASKPIKFPNDKDSKNYEYDQDNHLQLKDISGRSTGSSILSALDGQPKIQLSTIQSRSLPSGKFRFPVTEDNTPNGQRLGRVMNSDSKPAAALADKNSTKPRDSRESQQQKPGTSAEGESSRKASPDVQDIIDGIVKLLGGKVHNGPPGGVVPMHQGYRAPPVSPNPGYNLFNPTKPIFFQTAKPTRINNRGPPLPLSNASLSQNQQPGNQYNGNNDNNNNNNNNNPPHTDNSFEAIPLEALNTDFNLNRGSFGPPFPLSKVPSGVEAPYKNGIPVPQQLVPTNNGNLNLDRYQINRYENPSSPNTNYNRPQVTNRPFENTKKSPPSTTLLVPLTNKPNQHRPTVTFPEDDEADDLRFTTNVNFDLNKNKTPHESNNNYNNANLEPTVIDVPDTTTSVNPSISENPDKVEGTLFEFSQLPSSNNLGINPTASDNSVYPTLVLETNRDNGLVEIVTKYSTISSVINPTGTTSPPPSRPPVFYPDSNLNRQVQNFNSQHPSTPTSTATNTASTGNQNPATSLTTASTPLTTNPFSIHSLPTPPLRPGIVISDVPSVIPGVGSVEVVTAEDGQTGIGGQVGEVFDVTVTAQQNYGGQATGQPFIVPVNLKDEVITAPNGNQQFVSIDGKRTYFNLHPSTAAPGIVSRPTQTVSGTIVPVIEGNANKNSNSNNRVENIKPNPNKSIGVGSVGAPVPLLPQPPGKTLFGSNSNAPNRPVSSVSTSLSISPGPNSGSNDKGIISVASGGNKTPPNIIRRPLTRRPSVPPVRIDTCIVGDDSTCNSEQFEVCRTENGVSSCVCRSGYARRRHREPCKAIISLVLSIKLDKLGDKKLSYNPDYFNPNSETYQNIEWETIHAMDSAMGETTLSGGYVGSKLDAIGFDGKHAVVNTTVLIQENLKMPSSQIKRELQKQMIQVLTRNRNNFGKSQLWVEGPISAVSAITDLDECEDPDTHDCSSKAECINTFGSFECKCESGYGDPYEKDKRRSGRRCESCNGKSYCNARGECLIDNGQKVCKCSGNYYGSQCDVDGEVLAVAIGASVSAVIIIGLTLACLCMWSRRWKKEEQKAALMSRTLFGGMATQALSYLGGKSQNPYQQHVTMDERLRWAQVNETGNIYVQNDPMTMHTSPNGLMGPSMMETPPMMSARRSADQADANVEDIFDERQTAKRPRSRCSQMQGGIYYDVDQEQQQCSQSDIYASRSMMHFPAQFCVPMTPMGHYAHTNRGFYA